jgi:hypothetical protein
MAIQQRHQRPGGLEFDAAAQAAAVDGGHDGFLCGSRWHLTYVAKNEIATQENLNHWIVGKARPGSLMPELQPHAR